MTFRQRLNGLALALLLPGFAACSDPGSAQRTAAAFEILPVDSAAARRLAHKGSVVGLARWRDSLGTHTLLLTQTGKFPTPGYVPAPGEDPPYDAEVYAYDYVDDGSSRPRLLWRTMDFQRQCPLDLFAGFMPGSLTVTDLDTDGIGEATFIYTLQCTSDVSPPTRKLIMREGARKYAIRGAALLPQGYGGGAMDLDPAFDKAPAPLRAYAVRRWRQYVDKHLFEQF